MADKKYDNALQPAYPMPAPFANTVHESELIINAYLRPTQLINHMNIIQLCIMFYHVYYEYPANANSFDMNETEILSHSIARGRTAQVHHALHRQTQHLALKQLQCIPLTDTVLADFRREIQILQRLQHPNIIQLMADYHNEQTNELYLVMEWLPNGNLYDLLFFSRNKPIEYKHKLTMLIDIARGMQYVHSQRIIHCDLKLHNLLLDKQHRVKIADFGYSIQLESMDEVVTDRSKIVHGGYMAPEIMLEHSYYANEDSAGFDGFDRKVDVFNFGVILWEMYERKNGFEQRCFRYKQDLINGERPNISDECNAKYKALITRCWQTEAAQRPDFDEVLHVLLYIFKQ